MIQKLQADWDWVGGGGGRGRKSIKYKNIKLTQRESMHAAYFECISQPKNCDTCIDMSKAWRDGFRGFLGSASLVAIDQTLMIHFNLDLAFYISVPVIVRLRKAQIRLKCSMKVWSIYK